MTTTHTRLTTSIALSLIAIFSSSSALANLDNQFSACAAKAIESQNLIVKKIFIDLPSNQAQELDHDLSPGSREYRMKLVNKVSGKPLGKISCRVDSSGVVESVNYISKI